MWRAVAFSFCAFWLCYSYEHMQQHLREYYCCRVVSVGVLIAIDTHSAEQRVTWISTAVLGHTTVVISLVVSTSGADVSLLSQCSTWCLYEKPSLFRALTHGVYFIMLRSRARGEGDCASWHTPPNRHSNRRCTWPGKISTRSIVWDHGVRVDQDCSEADPKKQRWFCASSASSSSCRAESI